MAWRKKFWRRGSRTRNRKIPASKIPRSIARVRTDWVTVYNITDQATSGGTNCSWLVAPWSPITLTVDGTPEEQCFSSFSFDVVDASRLTDLYGDDVKVVRQVGGFWLRPVFEAEDACSPDQLAILQAAWQDYFIRARGALWKFREVSNPGSLAMAHPLFGRDWSDAGFIRQFERNWHSIAPESISTTYGEGQLINSIGAVTRAQYTTPITTDGNQTSFSVPEIRTDCFNCEVGTESCYDGPSHTRYVGPNWKHVNISSSRTIRLKEDDTLRWVIDWARFAPGQNLCGSGLDRQFPCAMQIIPDLKVKLQYG